MFRSIGKNWKVCFEKFWNWFFSDKLSTLFCFHAQACKFNCFVKTETKWRTNSVYIYERVKMAKSSSNFKNYVAHFDDCQGLCSHCVQICSTEGLNNSTLFGHLVHNCSVRAKLILKPMLKLRDLSDQFKNCLLGAENDAEGVVSQIAFSRIVCRLNGRRHSF